MHTLKLKLKLTKYQYDLLNYIFFVAHKMYVRCVKYVQKQIRKFEKDKKYKHNKYLYIKYKNKLSEYENLSKDLDKKEIDKKTKSKLKKYYNLNIKDLDKRLKVLQKERKEIISKYLSKTDLEKFVKLQQYKYKNYITSAQAQKIADFIYNSVESYLYKNGKTIHIKSFKDFNTISQKSLANGLKYINNKIKFFNEEFEIIFKNTNYERQSLSSEIKYLELIKKEFANGNEFYVNFVLDGEAPRKIDKGLEEVGVDPGISHEAVTGDTFCLLEELAPRCKVYDKEIQKLQRQIDMSTRATNPDLYNKDGTVKKGSKGKFVYSKHCKYLKRRLRMLYKKKSDYIKCMHGNLTNRIIEKSDSIKIEDMNFNNLAKRSKKTERSDKVFIINGKEIKKFKKKKRYGKSINDRSPGLFVTMLEEKANRYGVTFEKVDTTKVKASQYEHDKDTYVKYKLSERTKIIDENLVQRDLYSAYIIKNVEDLNKINKTKCKENFKVFLNNQEQEFKRIKDLNIKNKNFGI